MTTFVFYVYLLYRDDEQTLPFYVGKGKGRRMWWHEGDYLREKSHKMAIIKKILREGRTVPKRKLDCDNEADAFATEIYFIARYGRLDLGTGVLANLTDGGEGGSGYVQSAEAIAKMGAANRGRKQSPEHVANRVAAFLRGSIRRSTPPGEPDTCAPIVPTLAAATGGFEPAPRPLRGSAEYNANMSAVLRGRKHSPERTAKSAAANRDRKRLAFATYYIALDAQAKK
jgi:NUMOD3 motif